MSWTELKIDCELLELSCIAMTMLKMHWKKLKISYNEFRISSGRLKILKNSRTKVKIIGGQTE